MRERAMLKIGEFARIGQVSIVTLRYYDRCGLLKPNALDADTGYRYYSLGQLPRLNRILALRELGFSLEQIARLLEESLSLDQLRGMFLLKQAQTQHRIDTEQTRLMRILARLRQIEQEEIMPAYEVLLKQVDPLLVASLRKVVPIGANPEKLYATLASFLDQQHIVYSQPAMLLLHSRHEWHDNELAIDVEAAVPLSSDQEGNALVSTRTLPGGLMASTIHIGDNLSLGRAHMALHRWLKENEHQLIGPPRLIYLQRTGTMNADQCITEVQFPVRKQAAIDEIAPFV